ncbi:hypothetical protein FOXYSP1_06912 [Fusarium oxysporum f. sp. phaseoli]
MFSDSHIANPVSTFPFTVLPKLSVRIVLHCFNNWCCWYILRLSMVFLETLLEVVGTAETQIHNALEHTLQNIERKSRDLVAI